ncbi:MAG: GIY-YIG nuclease family protein [Bacteroidota bacterium]|jgi:predicted GIY-YIG superfamily endonuclease|nr:GIY-YIG nuclease family protein [Bacteroidota bacterium]
MKESWVYILECRDGSYYTGCTTNIEQRLAQHEAGVCDGYTSKRLPVKLVWTAHFSDIRDAISAERRLKKWSRKKKAALIRGDIDALRRHAKKTF